MRSIHRAACRSARLFVLFVRWYRGSASEMSALAEPSRSIDCLVAAEVPSQMNEKGSEKGVVLTVEDDRDEEDDKGLSAGDTERHAWRGGVRGSVAERMWTRGATLTHR